MAVDAVSPPCVQGRRAVAAKGVLAGSHRLKVVRVHAGSIAAQVVQGLALIEGADQALVNHAVGASRKAAT